MDNVIVGTVIHILFGLLPIGLAIAQVMSRSVFGIYYCVCMWLCMLLQDDILGMSKKFPPIEGVKPTKKEIALFKRIDKLNLKRRIVTYVFVGQLLVVSIASLVVGIFSFFDKFDDISQVVIDIFDLFVALSLFIMSPRIKMN